MTQTKHGAVALSATLVLAAALAGCELVVDYDRSDIADGSTADSGTDSGADTGTDTGEDAAEDTGPADAGADAADADAVDGDVGDGGEDAGEDTGPPDAGDPCDGVDCSSMDGACVVGVCDSTDGSCTTMNRPDTTACVDGDACTTGDQCTSGTCAGTALDCSGMDGACVVGVCDGAGACTTMNRPDTTACVDGDACTTGDQCTSGTCAGTALDCSGMDGLCVAGVCDGAGGCTTETVADGTMCDDGDAATTDERCFSGSCLVAATLSVTPEVRDFPDTLHGTDSAAVTFTVENLGGQATGVVSTALAGADPGAFRLTSDGCDGAPLAGGASCTLDVVFAPTSAADFAARLDVSGTPGGAVSATLGGTGVLAPAALVASPTSHDFGTITTTTDMVTITIRNAGEQDSGTLATGLTGASQMTILSDACVGTTLAPSTSCDILVLFTPTDGSTVSADLAVTATPGGTVSVTIGGSAT